MKYYFIHLLLLFTLTPSFGQENKDAALYIDSLGNISEEVNYKLIIIVKNYYVEKKEYQFSDYYKSGKVALTGTTKDRDRIRLDGTAVSFNENGSKKQISNYNDSHLEGKQFQWHDNGVLQFEKEFTFDKIKNESIEKLLQYWDSNNLHQIIDGNGMYDAIIENDSEGIEQKNSVYEKGEIKNGYKHGVWTGNSSHPKIRFQEEYENGKLITGTSTDDNNIQYIYTEVRQKPTPKTGINDFYKYVGRNFKTPNIQGLSGKIYLTFIVDREGKLVETKILRDIGFGTGAEALRIIKEAKNWIPGKIRGIPVRFFYALPITVKVP